MGGTNTLNILLVTFSRSSAPCALRITNVSAITSAPTSAVAARAATSRRRADEAGASMRT